MGQGPQGQRIFLRDRYGDQAGPLLTEAAALVSANVVQWLAMAERGSPLAALFEDLLVQDV
eukprot:2379225-Pyramimonas_sp.AAC.1